MSQRVQTIVVGGGVVGSAAAWALARRGADVILLERFDAGHVRGASHGATRIYRTTYTEPEYLDLTLEAHGLWRELEAATGEDILTITGGVASGGPSLQGHLADLAAALGSRGVPHALVRSAEAAERWPGLAFEGQVLVEPETAGRLHADRAVAAFQADAVAHGARIVHGRRVTAIEDVPGGVLVRTEPEPFAASGDDDVAELVAQRVVVAAGAWSTDLLVDVRDGEARRPELAGLARLVVTQEQPAHFAPRDPVVPWPSFTHDPGADVVGSGRRWPSGAYGLETPGEGVKVGFHAVGPVVHPDRRTFQPDERQLAQLRDYAATWVPGVDPDAFEAISCTYTTTPDHDFVLDRVGRVVVAAGFSGHGFKFAPALGRVLADLADEALTPDAPVGARAERFALARLTVR